MFSGKCLNWEMIKNVYLIPRLRSHPSEAAGARTHSYSYGKLECWIRRNAGLDNWHLKIFWYMLSFLWKCLVFCFWYETCSVSALQLWLCTAWKCHWIILDLKQCGHIWHKVETQGIGGGIPKLVSDSPKEIISKQ
jgi:hypothetical protein